MMRNNAGAAFRCIKMMLCVSMIIISSILIVRPLYAVEDDLDKFFEDYFSDEGTTTETKAPSAETKTTPAQTPPQEEKKEVKTETVSNPATGAAPFQQANAPGSEKAQAASAAVAPEVMPVIEEPPLEQELQVGASYIDSYIEEWPTEQWRFSDVHAEANAINRNIVIDKTIKMLIGEEIERPMIEIRGDRATKPNARFKTLKECLLEGVKHHLPIDIAREKVLLYRRHIRKAMRDLFPQVTGILTESNNRFGSAPDGYTKVDDIKLLVRQPIYAGGSLWNKVRENQANLKMAMAEYNKIYSDLALEIATAYFNLSKARTMLKYRESLLDKAHDALKLSEEKYAANLISEIEHLNVQSQESQLNHNVQQAKEDIELALLELQKSMYLDLDVNVDVMGLDDYFETTGLKADLESGTDEKKKVEDDIEQRKLDELINMAYENRPEFVIGENKVRAKKYAEKAEEGKWLPQINLFCEMGKNQNWMHATDLPKTDNWKPEYHVGLECSWNVFGNTMRYVYDNNQEAPNPSGYNSGGKGNWSVQNSASIGLLDNLEQFTTVKEKEIERKEAILEFELSEKDMVSEVKESYYNYNRARIQMRSVLKKLAYREKLVELARHRSEINEIQLSEYLQAEIDLVEERNTFYQAMVDYFIARASLNKAIGMSNFVDIEKMPPELQV